MRQLIFGTIIALSAGWLFTTNCNQRNVKDIREYYFPLRQLQDGLVYEYAPVRNDSLPPVYWYFRSFVLDTGIYLTSTYYSYELTPAQLVREEMVKNGMLLTNLYLYESDSTGRQQRADAEIIAGSVFPFEVRDSGGVFLYKVRWKPVFSPDVTITLTKNRRYAGDTTFVFQNKRHDCVVFDVRELVEQEQEGYFEQQFSTVEWYAKGLGLVYYCKNITNQFILEYRLVDRYPMEQLEARFRQKLLQ